MRRSLSRNLRFSPPLDWARLLEFLRARAIPGVEAVDDGEYRRTVELRVGRTAYRGWLRVARARSGQSLRLEAASSLAAVATELTQRVRRLFDLDAEPAVIAAALGKLGARFPGVRVPGAFDGFETVIRAILGQQISVARATALTGRLATRFGSAQATPFAGLDRRFPKARVLARAAPAAMGELGIVRARVRAIRELAAACAAGRLTLSPDADVEQTMRSLLGIHGIGAWTAEYAAMRALKWPDAFPAADHGLLTALGLSSPREAMAHAERFRPYRAYAAMCLWQGLGAEP